MSIFCPFSNHFSDEFQLTVQNTLPVMFILRNTELLETKDKYGVYFPLICDRVRY